MDLESILKDYFHCPQPFNEQGKLTSYGNYAAKTLISLLHDLESIDVIKHSSDAEKVISGLVGKVLTTKTIEREVKETAKQFLQTHDSNLYAEGMDLRITILGKPVEVETIWFSKDENKVYVHVGCLDFEGDLDVESLSDEQQKEIAGFLSEHI